MIVPADDDDDDDDDVDDDDDDVDDVCWTGVVWFKGCFYLQCLF